MNHPSSAKTTHETGSRAEPLPSFDAVRRVTNVQGLKAATTVAFIVVGLFAIVEYRVVPERFALLQILRAICLLVLLVAGGLAFRGGAWVRRHVDVLTIAAFLSCGWYSIALMSLHEGYESTFFLTLVFIIVGVGAVTLWPLRTALLYMTLVIVSYLAPLLFSLVDVRDFDSFLIDLSFLLGMAVISVVAQQLRYRVQKREFLANRNLAATKNSLQEAYQDLQELDQFKTEFFANVSHELRTPLTLSLGPLESLLRNPHTPEEEEELQTLHRNQLRLMRLINQLLDVAKVESGRLQVEYCQEDAAALVRAIVDEVRPAARNKGLEVDLIAPRDPVWLYVDREKIEQVVFNLLSNAFKFTDAGGRISVFVGEGEHSTRISVRDTGAGIPADKLPTVFDRFTQADGSETRRYAGTGIGLALVRSYVEIHGGSVEAESELGGGSVFTVSLPQGRAHLPAAQIRETSPRPSVSLKRAVQMVDFDNDPTENVESVPGLVSAPTESKDAAGDPRDADWVPEATSHEETKPRVLLVDDNGDMRRYLRSLLRDHYEVKSAQNGAEALAIAKEWEPDLVVSDVMMPVMSGSELCRAIKQAGGRLSRIPVVLVTARTEEHTKLRGLEYGADDYLLKPFVQEELLLRVRNLVAKRRQERALFDAHLTLRAQQKYLQSDLELARQFQNDLLSELDMPVPLTAHVEFRPADLVGGDFYHLTSLGPTRVRLLIADMVDHGVKAAVRAAAALPEYTALSHASLDPAGVLEQLNQVATSKYADLAGSFLCMDLDASAGGRVTIQYARAGEMPFVIVSESGPTQPPAAEGFMIGLFPNMSYQSRNLEITPKTRLFLYTDGLYTQTNVEGRSFREAGDLKMAWRAAMDRTDLRDATGVVVESFNRFRGSVPQFDDVTVMGIEVEDLQ